MANDPTQGGLFGIDPSLLFNIGTGLLAAGGKNLAGAGNVGTALQGSMQNYYAQKQAQQDMQVKQQQMALGNLNLQQMQQEMPLRMDFLKAVGQRLHLANNDPGVTKQLQVQGLMSDTAQDGAPPVSSPLGSGMPGNGASAPPAASMSAGNSQMLPPLGNPQMLPPMRPAPVASPSASVGPRVTQQSDQDDPMDLIRLGAYGAALGMPGAQGLQELGKAQLQYDPALATKMEAAKSQVAVGQQQIQQALSQGNTGLAAGLAQKMRQDLGLLHIASMSGTQTRIGLDGNISTFNPNEGLQTNNGVESVIPGATGARGALAASEALGRAQGETSEVTDRNGNVYTVPKASLLGAANTAARTPGALPPMSSIGPGRKQLLSDQSQTANETFKQMQEQADASNLQLAQIADLKSAANDFTPGKFAESRGEMLQYLNSTGLITDAQKNSLGSYQAGQKISIQLQSAATKALGSREAAQVFGAMGKSIPNLTMSQDGLAKVAAFMEGMSRYNIARATTVQQRYNAGDVNGVNSAKDEYYQKTNPAFYIFASAPPATRAEMLKSSPNPTKLMTDWVNAYKQGMAPSPGGYQ